MKYKVLLIITMYLIFVTKLSDEIGVFSVVPGSLLFALPFTVVGVSSGTILALIMYKVMAATAVGLHYKGMQLAFESLASSAAPGGARSSSAPPGGTRSSSPRPGAAASPSPMAAGMGAAARPAMPRQSEDDDNDSDFYKFPSDDEKNQEEPLILRKRGILNNVLATLEPYFRLISKVDTKNCILRLICELEHKSKHSKEELIILLVICLQFSPQPKEVSDEMLKTASGAYYFAAYVGASSADSRCTQFYGQCPNTSLQLMSALRRLGSLITS